MAERTNWDKWLGRRSEGSPRPGVAGERKKQGWERAATFWPD